jgi:F-type H+-transporting ATPase subunit b
MTRRSLPRFIFLAVAATILAAAGWAQEHSSKSAEERQSQSEHQKPAHPQQEAASSSAQPSGPEAELAEASREAAGEDETAEFKQSATVRWFARITGLKPFTAYWVFVILNFAIVLWVLVTAMKSKLPGVFRGRTENIQKGIAEARQASEEAQRRLTEIESRLAKLDSEIATMAGAAESEARKEEARIQAAAEEDKRKVVEAAEQEIVAATRLARAQLRAYVSELAVSLAEKRIQVTSATDQGLVRAFVDELRKDGK